MNERLYSIPGQVPSPVNLPDYCYFCNRCDFSFDHCEAEYPEMTEFSPTHKAACFLYEERFADRHLDLPTLSKAISSGAEAEAARSIPSGFVDLQAILAAESAASAVASESEEA